MAQEKYIGYKQTSTSMADSVDAAVEIALRRLLQRVERVDAEYIALCYVM